MIRYDEELFGLPAIRIVAGEYAVTAEDVVMVTLLGSCVAACIRDPLSGVCGMNHFMLPSDSGTGSSRSGANYGLASMRRLLDDMIAAGANPACLQAKVFGGGDVSRHNRATGVGKMNVEFALEYLESRGIEILAADVRGTRPRKIFFVQRTGQVFVRYLNEYAMTRAV